MRLGRVVIGLALSMLLVSVQAGWAATEVRDGFDQGLAKWDTGKHPKVRKDKPVEVTVKEGQVVFPQHYGYLQTKDEIKGDFEFSFDVISIGSTPQMANLWVQLTSAPELGGIFRFGYGADERESINLGLPPMLSANPGGWDGIDDGQYLRNIDHTSAPHQGRITLTCQAGKIKLAYANDQGESIETPFVFAGNFDATKVRIWGMKGTAVDNVKLVMTEPAEGETTGSEPGAGIQGNTPDPGLPADQEIDAAGYVMVGDLRYELNAGVIATESGNGTYLTAIVLYPDVDPEPHMVNINVMHSGPDCAGTYENTRGPAEGGFSGTVIVIPEADESKQITWVLTKGNLEIKRENGEYVINLSCEGVNALGASAAHGPETVRITLHYAGELLENN